MLDIEARLYALQGFRMKYRVDKIDFEACVPLLWDLVLQEIPVQTQELVVPQILFGAIPGEKAALRVQHGVVPRQPGIDVVLCKERTRGHRRDKRQPRYDQLQSILRRFHKQPSRSSVKSPSRI